jgi:acyl-CoA synthetase (AMP-forming)/AMP-acid ligase II
VTAATRSAGELSTRLREVLALDPSAPMIEFQQQWISWGEVAAIAGRVADAIPTPGTQVGVLLRNTPAHVAACLGVLLADACLVTINPGLGERTRADLAALDLGLLVGTAADLDAFGVNDAPQFALDDTVRRSSSERGSQVETRALRADVAVLMLTSGTTGPPKRVEITAQTLLRTMSGAKHYESARHDGPVLRSGVAIVNSPLVHLGGLFRVVQCTLDGRSFVLLPRFEVNAWADAVRRYHPKTASLVPTALRMVLDSDLTRDDLASLLSVISGTAPLDPADAEAFTERFGVPVLTSYAATEFGGGVAGWNLADYKQFAATKRGSVGRAHAGCGLRVVDPDGAELEADAVGLLEVRPAQFGPGADWVRTTDLARIDADGFLWILGRADQTIIRGGFKVQPETVRAVLEQHPAVRGAVVFGVADQRLGEVPVAVVESRGDIDAAELLAFASERLARYEIPTEIVIVEELPRTASGKADLTAARALVADRASR